MHTSGLPPRNRSAQHAARPPAASNATSAPNLRFSYTESPRDAPSAASSLFANSQQPLKEPTTPLSPMTPTDYHLQSFTQAFGPVHPQEKAANAATSDASTIPVPTAMHPAYAAPQAGPESDPPSKVAIAQSLSSGISPLPVPITMDTERDTSQTPTSPIRPDHDPHSRHTTAPQRRETFQPTLYADASTRSDPFLPGLHNTRHIPHPNMTHAVPSAFKHGLCDCSDVSTCLTGLFCPCLLYGRTSYRRSQKAEKKDPTDLLGYSACNGHCTTFALACGLHWMAALLQRLSVRRLYKIEGSFAGDLAKSCCCCCCVLVQSEREIREREERGRLMTGPGTGVAYESPGQMIYAPPPRG